MRKRVLSIVLIAVLLMTVCSGTMAVKAANQTVYVMNAQTITQFKKSKGKLTMKGELYKYTGALDAIDTSKLKAVKKNKISLKLSKNCFWYHMDMNQKLQKITYAKLAKQIDKERKLYKKALAADGDTEYETNFSVVLVVQKNQIIAVAAAWTLPA